MTIMMLQSSQSTSKKYMVLANFSSPHFLSSFQPPAVITASTFDNAYEADHARTDLISNISDPEHPLTLGSLSVVNLPDIFLTPTFPERGSSSPLTTLTVLITPTITHCSLATVIGLGVRVRLEQALPPRFRVDVRIKEGTHSTAEQVNRQLGDKERVAAALENGTLMGVLRKMLEGCNNATE